MRLLPLVLAVALLLAPACGGGEEAATKEPTETRAAEGDPARGKEIFLTRGCKNCHAFTPAGTTDYTGPNLDLVVRRYDAEFIRESLVNPDAYIEKGSGGSIGGDREYRVPMPNYGPQAENSENQLTEQQLADLLAFLLTSKPD